MNKQTIGAAALLAALVLGGCSSGQTSSGTGADSASSQSTAAAAAAGGAGATGQAGPGTNPGARRHFREALLSLNLSDAQKSQIREIMTTARATAKTQDPDARRATMRAAFAKVQAVLTPAQRAQFQAKLAALRAQQPTAQAPAQ